MFLPSLCSEIMDNIVVFLDPKTVLRASQSSNAMANLLKKHLLSVKCTESAQAEAMGLFHTYDGALFGFTHVLKIASIASNPCRVDTLKNWIKSQVVCIDADGFFVRKQHNMNFGTTGLDCVRINLWDKPLSESKTYYGRHGNEVITTLYLQADFFPFMYNP